MSIQSQIDRLQQAKADLIEQITAKGVTVPADASLDDLAALVQAISTGVELPDLDIPATVTEVFSGYEYIDEAGTKKTGTFTVETEITEQDALLAELGTVLAGKAAGGVETCRVVIIDDTSEDYTVLTYTALEDGKIVTKQVENPFVWNDEYEDEATVLENVVVGTSVTFNSPAVSSYDAFTGENFETWFVAQTMAMDMGFLIWNLKILGDATITITWY